MKKKFNLDFNIPLRTILSMFLVTFLWFMDNYTKFPLWTSILTFLYFLWAMYLEMFKEEKE